jgi:hypothetical protein
MAEELLHFLADRKQRARKRQGTSWAFKVTPLVTYFLQ